MRGGLRLNREGRRDQETLTGGGLNSGGKLLVTEEVDDRRYSQQVNNKKKSPQVRNRRSRTAKGDGLGGGPWY